MRSAIYIGWLGHHRHGSPDPGRPEHRFRYRLTLPLLDLDELDEVCALHPLWSTRRPNLAWVRPADFLGRSTSPFRHLRGGSGPDRPLSTTGPELADRVRDLVAERLGFRPSGPVALLANPRTLGWFANPLAVYYCRDAGDALAAVVLEVTNTPWHERHHYVVAGAGEHVLDKALHVSPFLGMDRRYLLRVGDPAASLTVAFEVLDDRDTSELTASLTLERRPMSRSSLGSALWRHALQPQRVSAGIYGHAAALAWKGARFHSHPGHPLCTSVPNPDGR